MVDDTLYITPHETALAVVATSMKKSRLRLHALVVDSIMGAMLFSAGGMLYVMCEAENSGLIDRGYTGIVSLFQGAVYTFGLFFVIQTGMELFNSNVLFFTVGVLRGAVSMVDLIISWTVSFWVNLGSTIFVVYVICYLSGILKEPQYVEGTLRIAKRKIAASFMETFLRAIAGNFCVCLATYLQMMVKPPHVKFLMLFFPIFTFVAMGFTHVVADMFLVPCGIFNNCGYGFGHYFWKIMLPGALGNIVGGVFFSVMIPWFLHLVVIEQDMKKLNLPAYEEKDEQPMLNMDSRVVRVINRPNNIAKVSTHVVETGSLCDSLSDENEYDDKDTTWKAYSSSTGGPAKRAKSVATSAVRLRRVIRSPKGVFPVAGMGPPLRKERTIASAYTGAGDVRGASGNRGKDHQESEEDEDKDGDEEINEDEIVEENPYDAEQSRMSTGLMKAITRVRTKAHRDIESATGGSAEDRASRIGAPLSKLKTKIKRASFTGHVKPALKDTKRVHNSAKRAHSSNKSQHPANASMHSTKKAHPSAKKDATTSTTLTVLNTLPNEGVQQLIASRRMGRELGSSSSPSPDASTSVRTLTPTMYGVDDREGNEAISRVDAESSDCEVASINSESPVSMISDSSIAWEQRRHL